MTSQWPSVLFWPLHRSSPEGGKQTHTHTHHGHYYAVSPSPLSRAVRVSVCVCVNVRVCRRVVGLVTREFSDNGGEIMKTGASNGG